MKLNFKANHSAEELICQLKMPSVHSSAVSLAYCPTPMDKYLSQVEIIFLPLTPCGQVYCHVHCFQQYNQTGRGPGGCKSNDMAQDSGAQDELETE